MVPEMEHARQTVQTAGGSPDHDSKHPLSKRVAHEPLSECFQRCEQQSRRSNYLRSGATNLRTVQRRSFHVSISKRIERSCTVGTWSAPGPLSRWKNRELSGDRKRFSRHAKRLVANFTSCPTWTTPDRSSLALMHVRRGPSVYLIASPLRRRPRWPGRPLWAVFER